MKNHISISPNIINRIPKYLRLLHNMKNNGVDRTSSAQIAQLMGTTPSQVRQDLSAFGSFGSQGYGYNVNSLIFEIDRILGLNEKHNIAVIGVGGIGRALLEHMEFEEYNYQVCAAFDISPELVGTYVNGIEIQHIDSLNEAVKEFNLDICMLTVPQKSAKEIAAKLVSLGIPAIWNFTNEDLGLAQSNLVVQDVNFLDSLFTLTYYLENQFHTTKMARAIAI